MLGSGAHLRHAAQHVLRRGHDLVPVRQTSENLRLPERLAAAAGIGIEFIRKRDVRKEDLVKEALVRRGEHPGPACILSAMEPCSTCKPWHDQVTGKTYLRPDDGKCLHYYFYLVDDELGLCYVLLPTWLPRRLYPSINAVVERAQAGPECLGDQNENSRESVPAVLG